MPVDARFDFAGKWVIRLGPTFEQLCWKWVRVTGGRRLSGCDHSDSLEHPRVTRV
jgi:hypothetical protein